MGKGARQRSARERLAEERRRKQERQRRLRQLAVAAGSIAVVAAVVAGFLFFQAQRNQTEGYAGPFAPVTRQDDGTYAMVQPDAQNVPTLDIFEDFQCPACKQFEEKFGETVKELAGQGKAKVVYHPFVLFRDEPTRSNSMRASSAARCVPEGKWVAYHDKLFENQPSERTENGFPLDDLVAYGKEVGIQDGNFATCVREEQKKSEVEQFSQRVLASGIEGTPTVRLNGQDMDQQLSSEDAFRKAVEDAEAPQR